MRDKFFAVPQNKCFFLADVKFWDEHENELDEWCAANSCERQGMVVTAQTDYAYTIFILRWA